MKLNFFTLASMVAAGTVMEDKEIAQSGSSDFEELRRQIYAELARRLDDETASPADKSLEQSENMPEERERRWWAHAETASPDDESLEQSENMPEERERRWWSHAETASPDDESVAENLHNTYAAMPEERQRRFWVRFFIGHPIKGKMIF